jgi:hydroxyacylglutathione hydrolase
MVQIESLVYNDFQVNTYLVWDETGESVVIDPAFQPGEESDSFDRILIQRGLILAGQINTHCHVDHLLGVRHVREKYGFPLRAHEEESKLLRTAPVMGEVFGLKLEPLDGIDATIFPGDSIPFGNHLLLALHVPGHSPGSLAFYSEKGGFVVTGDALFAGSIGRTDLPGGNYDQLILSIRTQLMSLPPETVVYPGHGPSSTIGEEKAGNPFLSMIE